MSVVVAIKENDRIYIGADSQVTKGGTRTTLKNPNNYKIWRVDDREDSLMAHVGNLRDGCVVRLMNGIVDDYDVFNDRIDYRFVVKYLMPEIVKNLKDAQYVTVNDSYIDFIDSSFLFAHKDRLYQISSDLSVIEVDDCCAIGSGSDQAMGSLLSTEGQDPKTRIVKAIKASAASDIYVDYPIILVDTKHGEFEIITEDNEQKYIHKKERKGE